MCVVQAMRPWKKLIDGGSRAQAVKNTHVNIVDLLDRRYTGQGVRVFDSVQELSKYTKDTKKYFPKENAYAGGVLKFLLRDILNPPPVIVSRARRPRRERRRRNA